MDERGFENGRTVGSVKAAIDKYGGKINQGASPVNKTQKGTSDIETTPSKAQELHLAKKRIDQISEDKKMAESMKSQADLELLNAKKLVRKLTSQIEESKAKTKEQKKDLQTLNKEKGNEQQTLGPTEVDDHQYVEIAREVEVVKRELSKIRLNMARLSEEKLQAEKEAEAASLKIRSYMSSTEQLRREIEEANEEEVLVELAQIQAQKELAAIEAQRKEEADKFSALIEGTRKKICTLREELEQTKDLEDKLAITNSDVNVLQQLKLIKEMDRTVESSATLKNSDLQSVTEDLEAAKRELESLKGGAFQLMTSMDTIRNELKKILEEKDQMKKLEDKSENHIQKMNSKLLEARDKLAAISASEEKAKSMLLSLSLALEKMETEKESAEKERELTREKITSIRAEIQKNESETDSTEERLQVAMQELEEVKSEEAKALNKLKTLVEDTATTRASEKKSTITISRFEYDYLIGSAAEAQETADKKVEAAHAWTEALRASQRELKIKIGLVERNIEELKLKEQQEIRKSEISLKAKELAEEELQNRIQEGNKRESSAAEKGYNLTPARQAKFRRSIGSPATRLLSSSTSFSTKRRRKVMLKIAKYIAGEQIENEKGFPFEEKE